jgi:threonine dehydrogenase-like Zn-dependent dehydrogenase
LNASLTDVKEEIFNNTNGRGADAVMEVVGSDRSLKLAIDLIRPGGVISSVGVHTAKKFSFSPVKLIIKILLTKAAVVLPVFIRKNYYRKKYCSVILLKISSPISLHEEGAKAYEVFDKKLDNCIKVVLLTS